MKISLWQKVAVVGCIAAGSLVAAQPALAVDGHQPFAGFSAALVAQTTESGDTQLYIQGFSDEVRFSDGPKHPLGAPWVGNGTTKEYNALAYNPSDGYAYAIANGWGGGNKDLLQIGSDGSVVDLGHVDGLAGGFLNNGTIVDGKHLLVIDRGGNTLYSIDVQTRQLTTRTLSATWQGADFASSQDPNVLWSVYGRAIQRLNLSTGKVDTFLSPLSDDDAGGSVFTYPNGDLGYITEGGNTQHFRIDNPNSAAPTFTQIASIQSFGSSTADATSVLPSQPNVSGHEPFDPNSNLGLWAPSDPGATQLYSVDLTKPTAPSTPLGAPWAGNGRVNTYNALAFNKGDGYAYAITGNWTTRDNCLVQIGSDGSVKEIGKLNSKNGSPSAFLNTGTIVNGKLLVTEARLGLLLSIDLKTAEYTQTTLSGDVWEAADFTSDDGKYLWGVIDRTFQRIDIASGTVTNFTNSIIPDEGTYNAGGILNAPNGDLVVSSNGNGTTYRFHVANPGSSSPTFTLVSSGTGPQGGDNDGTSTVDAQ